MIAHEELEKEIESKIGESIKEFTGIKMTEKLKDKIRHTALKILRDLKPPIDITVECVGNRKNKRHLPDLEFQIQRDKSCSNEFIGELKLQ